jgi:hypothetical protein
MSSDDDVENVAGWLRQEGYTALAGEVEMAFRRQPLPMRDQWQDIRTAPVACHFMVCYFDHSWGEWVVGVKMLPFDDHNPWTHWRHLGPMPGDRAA